MPAWRSLLTMDVGSTTTKAVLFATREPGEGTYADTAGGARLELVARANAPTTVEGPAADVMNGVRAALQRLSLRAGRALLDGGGLIRPEQGGDGVDALLVTSSAAGGLQMLCAGVVRQLTAESAERAALGAGAIVTDVVSLDGARDTLESIHRIRQLRPDLVLLAGGTDQADPAPVVRLAEWIAAAHPRSRADGQPVPVIFAGNKGARAWVERTFEGVAPLVVTENVRPELEQERPDAVRQAVHDLFLDHVMKHAPGYDHLAAWAGAEIEPTPRAAGRLLEEIARADGVNVLAFDIGGATTDVFSVVGGVFHRTVSANLGMSYSAARVYELAGDAAVRRWLPEDIEAGRLADWIYDKAVHPTTIPELPEEVAWEQALAREGLRLALEHHRSLSVSLKGVHQTRSFDDVFDQRSSGRPLVESGKVDVLVGSGGVLSHAPEPWQALSVLLDGVRIGGVFRVYLDEFFLLPHTGGVARHDPALARDLWFRHGLRPLATCVVPWGRWRPGAVILEATLQRADGGKERVSLSGHEVRRIALGKGEEAELALRPRGGVDLGYGAGRPVVERVTGGELGLVLDGRGCPLVWPKRGWGEAWHEPSAVSS